jgi:hypothetical protein
MKRILPVVIVFLLIGCAPAPTSNDTQRDMQNDLLADATAQTGMPSIKNFRERKILKDILELRDQTGLITYTYLENLQPQVIRGVTALGGKLTFFGETVGYGIPYATQYTAPETMQTYYLKSSGTSERRYGAERLPQADPNGLFSPASAEGTWVLMKDPNGPDTKPIYIEPRIVVSPFKLKFD